MLRIKDKRIYILPFCGGGGDPLSFPSIDLAEIYLRQTLLNSSKLSIPSGRRTSFTPSFSPLIKSLITERNALRLAISTQNSPSPSKYDHLQSLNKLINIEISKMKQNRWHEFVSSLNHKTSPRLLWNTIKSINNNSNPSHESLSPPTSNNPPSHKSQANTLIKYYASISHLPDNKFSRKALRSLKKHTPINTSFPPFHP